MLHGTPQTRQHYSTASDKKCFGPYFFCGPVGGNCHNCTTEVWHPMQYEYGEKAYYVPVDFPAWHKLEENK